MKIYIAGKITGLVYEEALAMFARAEMRLAELGHEPVNPMRHNGLDGDGQEHSWAEYMKRDIPLLLGCDAIYLLANWRDSRGARLEQKLAEDLGMTAVFGDLERAAEISAGPCAVCSTPITVIDLDAEVSLCGACVTVLEPRPTRLKRAA